MSRPFSRHLDLDLDLDFVRELVCETDDAIS
jgi:hypothetical protein